MSWIKQSNRLLVVQMIDMEKHCKNISRILKKSHTKHLEILFMVKPILGNSVKLVEFEPELRAMNSVITALFFEQSPSISFEQILKNVKKMSKKSKIDIIKTVNQYKTKQKA